jgi:uncharacterized membrane protein
MVGHPLHPMIIPFPIVCFVGAFVCDLVVLRSDDPFWSAAALYLLGADWWWLRLPHSWD